ncbi:hypothetical protein RHMOL_Rhmol03G0200000 [Rhododendron molle]|uniref:Uncharacterized protein n=1 Tax=Rhododendron molle TaxID=49168 RepID=A0ACC0PG51_RHOML|nr:hypothetical protein RHMOL_Rhmol03G0200000 [Rhododendron molle]
MQHSSVHFHKLLFLRLNGEDARKHDKFGTIKRVKARPFNKKVRLNGEDARKHDKFGTIKRVKARPFNKKLRQRFFSGDGTSRGSSTGKVVEESFYKLLFLRLNGEDARKHDKFGTIKKVQARPFNKKVR